MVQQPQNDAFLSLIEQHKRIVFKICNGYCRDTEKRKDLAQEIIIQLWKSYGKFDPKYKFSTWMYRIALNVAISFYRKEKKHSETSSITHAFDIADGARSPHEEGHTETETNLLLLHRFIDQLDELHKALMILYLDDNSYRDIGEVLGITESNVATKINRIKQKLKQQFTQHAGETINRQ